MRLPRSALSAPALDRDLRQDRHRDFLRRDGAEVEAGRRLDAVEGRGVDALADQFFAQTVVIGLYPSWDISEEAVARADEFLSAEWPPALRRLVLEGKAGVERALRARSFDAS